MKKDLLPLVSLGLFFWSAWEFYSGSDSLAYYLLGASIYVAVVIGVVFIFSIDDGIDHLERAIKAHSSTTIDEE